MYPRLFHIYGPIWIHSYGVMIALGFLTFLYCTLKHPVRKRLISSENYLNMVFAGLAGALLGGRLLYIITNFHEFSGSIIEFFFPWVGGFVVLGSIIGVLIAVPLYLSLKKIPILPILDLTALYAPLMHAISRIGCLSAGCCYGAPTASSWAITFTNLYSTAPLNIPLYPTQIYMSIASFLIFIFLYMLWPIFHKKSGLILFLFLICENFSRFFIDFWRGDRHLISMTGVALSQAQWFSLLGLVVSGGGFIWIITKRK